MCAVGGLVTVRTLTSASAPRPAGSPAGAPATRNQSWRRWLLGTFLSFVCLSLFLAVCGLLDWKTPAPPPIMLISYGYTACKFRINSDLCKLFLLLLLLTGKVIGGSKKLLKIKNKKSKEGFTE